MPDTHPNPDNETLIQTLLARYEAQLRRTLAQKPRTLEQVEDTAEQIGNQVKRDLQQEIVRQEGTGEQGKQMSCSCGQSARSVADYSRRYVTRHGALHLTRAYYHCRACKQGFFPLDRVWQLGKGEYSPAVVALSARFASYVPLRAAVRELKAVCRIVLSVNTLRTHAQLVGSALEAEWQEAEVALFSAPEKEVGVRPRPLHLTLDGVMVFVEGGWHEVKLGCAYTRGSEGGVDDAQYTALYAPSHVFGRRFRLLGYLNGSEQCSQVGIVGDGGEWIWQEVGKYYPTRVQILDYYHAMEHLWEVARVRFDAKADQAGWIAVQQERLLSDKVLEVIEDLGKWSAVSEVGREVRRRVLGYLHTPPSRMRYQTFRESGYHIGSGVAEAGCKGVIQARLKGVGMRWKARGLESLLPLRCGVCSSEVPDFRRLARQQLAAT